MKVVLDTNVYVSALLFDRGPERIIELGQAGTFRIYASRYIVDELHNTLETKLGTGHRFAELAAIRITRFAAIVGVSGSGAVDALEVDAQDSPIVKTCLNSKADFLVTGDKKLLKVRLRGVKILTPSAFLNHLHSQGIR